MKTLALFLGGAVLAGLWLGPLPAGAKTSFAAHMTLHMGVVAVAAPLLAFGLAAGRLDPVRHVPHWLPAVPLSFLELAVVWGWHAPALHRMARQSAAGFVVEQGTFLASAFLVWIAAVGGTATRRAERSGAGLAALLLTSMHMTLLGGLLALSPRALYPELCGGGAFSPLDDQHLGGAIMLVLGGVAYLAGGLWLAGRLVRTPARVAEGAA